MIDANIVFSNSFFIRLHLTLVSDQTENAEGWKSTYGLSSTITKGKAMKIIWQELGRWYLYVTGLPVFAIRTQLMYIIGYYD